MKLLKMKLLKKNNTYRK